MSISRGDWVLDGVVFIDPDAQGRGDGLLSNTLRITTSAQDFNNQFHNLALDIASTGDPLSKVESVGYYLQSIKEVACHIYNHYALQQSSTGQEDI
ncbi:hypothetical protein M427DRAFT_39939 [Gonapodya prolifera JEL478]|uniref:Uncharacterized protein n=1 Tax=Gonapodya prolifera (strain JEL478) TaxID=1344416 RepID=A0A138ZWZ9_GONPJ|nr:hypothetical protein M427DRAFT_39939 [Gonapodya prolifera JEL478]|eukprot:KXS08805.1 hypothetical protein M427DRAFT_39939 [Gonapodya prolifera JEL478]